MSSYLELFDVKYKRKEIDDYIGDYFVAWFYDGSQDYEEDDDIEIVEKFEFFDGRLADMDEPKYGEEINPKDVDSNIVWIKINDELVYEDFFSDNDRRLLYKQLMNEFGDYLRDIIDADKDVARHFYKFFS